MRDFVAVDVETANRFVRGSICQISIIKYSDGELHTIYSSLVNPEVEFDPFCTSIHGIMQRDVDSAPCLAEMLYSTIPYLSGYEVVAHNAGFDVSALEAAMNIAQIDPFEIRYGCTMWAARRAYSGLLSSFSLLSVCDYLNIPLYNHHNAEADAMACAQIAARIAHDVSAHNIADMMEACGLSLYSSFTNYYDPVESAKKAAAPHQMVIPEFECGFCDCLNGKNIVMTGNFGTMTRTEAMERAAAAGATIQPRVTRQTNVLVVGAQDLIATRGYERSSKHRKVDELNAQGHEIIIIDENSFLELIG